MSVILFQLLFWSTIVLALVRGDGIQRGFAIVIAVDVIGSGFMFDPGPAHRATLMTGVFLFDAGALVPMFFLVRKSGQRWPIWVCAMQVNTVMMHLLPVFGAWINAWAYHWMVAIWSYPQLIILAWVVAMRRRRQPAAPTASA